MLEPGLEATVEETVVEAMTAERLGSGTVPVLGTPAVLALVEAASVAAVASEIPDGQTTVGASAELEHLAPTPIGAVVTAQAGLVEVRGRRLRFRFEVTDPAGPIARGTHIRVLIDTERFLQTARDRSG